MGWYFQDGAGTNQEILNELTQPWTDDEGRLHTITNASFGAFGRAMYAAHRINGVVQPGVVIYLIERSRGQWGYKPQGEAMGTYQYDCPLALLDLVPPDDHFGWREKVRAYWADRAAPKTAPTVRVGDTVYLKGTRVDGIALPIVEIGARGGIIVAHRNKRYRVSSRLIDRHEPAQIVEMRAL